MTRAGITRTSIVGTVFIGIMFLLVPGNALAQSEQHFVSFLGSMTLDDGTPYLVDQGGRTLYAYLADEEASESACVDECAEAWPPVTRADALRVGGAADESLLGSIERSDGIQQITYGGWPLYYYADDVMAGDTGGRGASDQWYLVSPEGAPLGAERASPGDDQADEAEAIDTAESDSEGSAESTPSTAATAGGVPYTDAQAKRGMELYSQHCAACHQPNLGGNFEAPALAGVNFQNYWGGRALAEIYNYIHNTMPLGQGGALEDQTYADILAYILSANDYASSGNELEPQPEALGDITIPEPE